MLEIRDLHVHYGGIHALKGVSLDVPKGSIVTLIGANGAGKSSTLRAIAGLVKNKRGYISWNGTDISTKNPVDIVKSGIVMSPEGRRIFAHLTVLENLRLGAYSRSDEAGIAKDIDWVFELFPRLSERRNQKGGTLSGGEQQMLAVGRALMAAPQLVMLDEPSLGLAPLIVKEVFDIIRMINAKGMTVLLVEQNAYAALKVAHQAYVLEVGSITLSGAGEALLADDRVREAYLGGQSRFEEHGGFGGLRRGRCLGRPNGLSPFGNPTWGDAGEASKQHAMGKNVKLAVYSMGGTIDKVYFDDLSDYSVGDPQVGAILTQAGVDFTWSVTEIARKDSLYVTDEERGVLRERIVADAADHVLVTHGTDTMTRTAEFLAEIPGKTIVLTGAMSPARFAASDAPFNVGCAVGAVWSSPPGVYIAMSGRVFPAGAVRKNRKRGRFEDAAPAGGEA